MKSKNAKNDTIKLRVTEQEKGLLQKLAAKENTSLSAYILRKSLYADLADNNSFPAIIEKIDLANELYHEIQKHGDTLLKNRAENILSRRIGNEQKILWSLNQ